MVVLLKVQNFWTSRDLFVMSLLVCGLNYRHLSKATRLLKRVIEATEGAG